MAGRSGYRFKRKAYKPKAKATTKAKAVVKRDYKVDYYKGPSNSSTKILDISAMNRPIIPMKKNISVSYSSYMALQGVTNHASDTFYICPMSLYDPNFQATNQAFSNTSATGYAENFGTLPNQYTKFRVNYADVTVKCFNATEGTVALLVVSASRTGATDYATTVFGQNIATRPMAIARSMEYFGDSNMKTIKFRLYPWKALGITKRQYYSDNTYLLPYNASSGTTNPWIAFSVTDGAAPAGSGSAVLVRGQLWMETHVTAYEPNIGFAN